jgi:SAM-dependent methyltransferase
MSQTHWDSIYTDRPAASLAWHEAVPSTLPLVLANSTPDDPVIDVGGGASLLAAELVDRHYRDVTVLDVSERALAASRRALRHHSDVVRWIHADITEFEPLRRWMLWHDRALFHFLVEPAARDAYVSVAADAVAAGGLLIVSTFGHDGPERCAGLPVCRYDVGSLAGQFEPSFELVDGGPVTPLSTEGDRRPYVAVVARRA